MVRLRPANFYWVSTTHQFAKAPNLACRPEAARNVVNPHDPAGGVQVRTKDSLEEELGAQDVLEANDDRSHVHNDDGSPTAWDPCQIRILHRTSPVRMLDARAGE